MVGVSDFDGDQHIGPGDIEAALRLLTHSELSPEEVAQVCEKAVEEADVDGDGKLSYMEFEHVILRAPDFLSTFHIRLWCAYSKPYSFLLIHKGSVENYITSLTYKWHFKLQITNNYFKFIWWNYVFANIYYVIVSS